MTIQNSTRNQPRLINKVVTDLGKLRNIEETIMSLYTDKLCNGFDKAFSTKIRQQVLQHSAPSVVRMCDAHLSFSPRSQKKMREHVGTARTLPWPQQKVCQPLAGKILK